MLLAGLAVAGLAAWVAILLRWRSGLDLLILTLPFLGALILLADKSVALVLAKDYLFVAPLYLSLLLVHSRDLATLRLPPQLLLAIALLALIVILQMANPGVAGTLVALVGAKVWLFYVPLLLVASAAAKREADLRRLLRVMIATAPIPCLVGFAQLAGSAVLGHEETITAFYGEAAASATQGFTAFDYGGNLYRLPSTFVSSAHYFGYLEHTIIPAYIVARIDPSRRWRWYGWATLVLLVVASFLSGARTAFVFVPALLVLILVLDRVLVGAMVWVAMVPSLLFLALGVAGIDPLVLATNLQKLTEINTRGVAIGSVIDALERYPMGIGTGMNTGAARHVISDGRLVGYESQYAKVVTELGVLGLAAFLAVLGMIVQLGVGILARTRGGHYGTAAAAFLAYFILLPIHCLKGWPLDWEPGNLYYWIFAAMMLGLPHLESGRAGERIPAAPTLKALYGSRRSHAATRMDIAAAPTRMRPVRVAGRC